MKKNDKVQVKQDHPHHPNQIGYFQFEGEGKSQGIAVVSVDPVHDQTKTQILFCVGMEEITPVKNEK